MKAQEFTNNVNIWRTNEEQCVLDKITEPTIVESFEERDQTIIEGLVRKNLLIKVQGKYSTYVYPNV